MLCKVYGWLTFGQVILISFLICTQFLILLIIIIYKTHFYDIRNINEMS